MIRNWVEYTLSVVGTYGGRGDPLNVIAHVHSRLAVVTCSLYSKGRVRPDRLRCHE